MDNANRKRLRERRKQRDSVENCCTKRGHTSRAESHLYLIIIFAPSDVHLERSSWGLLEERCHTAPRQQHINQEPDPTPLTDRNAHHSSTRSNRSPAAAATIRSYNQWQQQLFARLRSWCHQSTKASRSAMSRVARVTTGANWSYQTVEYQSFGKRAYQSASQSEPQQPELQPIIATTTSVQAKA